MELKGWMFPSVVREEVSNVQGSTNELVCSTTPSEKSKVIRIDLLIFSHAVISPQMSDNNWRGYEGLC
jgi:hypothetical protein